MLRANSKRSRPTAKEARKSEEEAFKAKDEAENTQEVAKKGDGDAEIPNSETRWVVTSSMYYFKFNLAL